MALPGGYTSPERFVRAAFLRSYISNTETVDGALTGIFHLLDNVTIPKGVNIKKRRRNRLYSISGRF
ncbi:linear amide C-N hydrolase [uncultured Enterococcus sp.]|uniref:linear amide C-N hydrolase n=1 Tax=uncultured Enterococcus sp. TaxID=167972 RepID=UPI002AA81643|nr:linear amide C-N hydrolase [uncultured Enterococcus sp.]